MRRLLSLIVLLFTLNMASAVSAEEKDELSKVENLFKNTIAEINQTLAVRQSEFTNSRAELAAYADQTLIPIWSAKTTMRGLLGSENWNQLKLGEQVALGKAFQDTLQRYLQEGFQHYDGQRLEFVELKLHPSRPRGVLILKVIPNLLPSFEINLRIGKFDDKWQLYDASLQGVSYVRLKKDSFRQVIQEAGVNGLLESISLKNKGYIQSKVKSHECRVASKE